MRIRIECSCSGYGCGLWGAIVRYSTCANAERERPAFSRSLSSLQRAHVCCQTSRVNSTPAQHSESHVRQQTHAPFMEKGAENRGTWTHLSKRTGEHSDAPQSSAACECRGPLPELYEYEPLSVKAEGVRLMQHGWQRQNVHKLQRLLKLW